MSDDPRRTDDSRAADRAAVLAEARSWLRTPWAHRQCVKGAGVDCGKLIKACYVNTGLVEDFDEGAYSIDWMLHKGDEVVVDFLKRYGAVRVSAPLPADIAVFRYGRALAHLALVVAWPIVIHAYRRERAVVYGNASAGEFAGRPVQFFSRLGA